MIVIISGVISSINIFLVYEVPPRHRVPGLIPLLLAVQAVPLLRQILLLNAGNMEPLPFAVRILAGNHFSKRGSSTVAILWLFIIIVKIFLLQGRSQFGRIHFHFFPLEYFLFRPFLIFILEFASQESLILGDLLEQLVRDLLLLLCVPEHLHLFAGDQFEISTQRRWQFVHSFLLELFYLGEEAGLQGDERSLDILHSLVELADEAQEAVDIVGNSDHLVHEIIEVSIAHCFNQIIIINTKGAFP